MSDAQTVDDPVTSLFYEDPRSFSFLGVDIPGNKPTSMVNRADSVSVSELPLVIEESLGSPAGVVLPPHTPLYDVHPHVAAVNSLPEHHAEADKGEHLGVSNPLGSRVDESVVTINESSPAIDLADSTPEATAVDTAVDAELDEVDEKPVALLPEPVSVHENPAPEIAAILRSKEKKVRGWELLKQDLGNLNDTLLGVTKNDLMLKGLLGLAPMVVMRRSSLIEKSVASAITTVMAPIVIESARSGFDQLRKVHQQRLEQSPDNSDRNASVAAVLETLWGLETQQKKDILQKFWIGAKAGLIGLLQNAPIIETAIEQKPVSQDETKDPIL